MTTPDDITSALHELLPDVDQQPTAEEQVVSEWDDEHAQLTAEQAAAMFDLNFDQSRTQRLTELRTILRDSGHN